ncbi:hypothetical protein YB2330_004512 [Saitoella coloradoensis]
MGQYSFLPITILYLFFFPKATIGAQLQATILGLGGMLLGLAWSLFGRGVGAKINSEGGLGRAVMGVWLVMGGFGMALVKSLFPRLTAFSMMFLFISIWGLTNEVETTHLTSRDFLDLFWPTLFAALSTLLISVLILPKTATGAYEARLLSTLSTSRTLLSVATNQFFYPSSAEHADTQSLTDLQAKLRSDIDAMSAAYTEARHEIGVGYIPLEQFRPFAEGMRLVRASMSGEMSGAIFEELEAFESHTPAPASPIPKEHEGKEKEEEEDGDERFGLERIGTFDYTANNPFTIVHQRPSLQTLTSGSRPPSKTVSLHSLSGVGTPRASGSGCPRHGHSAATSVLRPPGDKELPRPNQLLGLLTHFRASSLSLSETLDQGFALISSITAYALGTTSATSPPPPHALISGYRLRLTTSIDEFRKEYRKGLEIAGMSMDVFMGEMYLVSGFMVGLLQVAVEVDKMVGLCHHLLDLRSNTIRKKIFLPRIGGEWWRSGSGRNDDAYGGMGVPGVNDGGTGRDGDLADEHEPQPWWYASSRKKRERKDDEEAAGDQPDHDEDDTPPTPTIEYGHVKKRNQRWVKFRLWLAKALYARHSHHAKFAFKMAFGLGLLGLSAWLPSSQSWYIHHRGTWMIISFFYTLEGSTGATVRVCTLRMIGTTAGAIYAYIAVMISQNHPEALAFFVALAAIPMSWFIMRTAYQGIGVVSAITLPPILFLPYLGVVEFTPGQVALVALYRGYQIALGILASLTINLFFWPYHARSHLISTLSQSIEDMSRYYLSISRQNLKHGAAPTAPTAEKLKSFQRVEEWCQEGITHTRALLGLVQLELRLLPLPIATYKELIPKLQIIFDSFTSIRRIREHLVGEVRKEVVSLVLEQRKDLVSSVLLNLFACSKALQSRSPMPQFLPSPLQAQERLLQTIKTHLRQQFNRFDFQYLYFFAEAEALRTACAAIEELVVCVKEVVGESAFLSLGMVPGAGPSGMMSPSGRTPVNSGRGTPKIMVTGPVTPEEGEVLDTYADGRKRANSL